MPDLQVINLDFPIALHGGLILSLLCKMYLLFPETHSGVRSRHKSIIKMCHGKDLSTCCGMYYSVKEDATIIQNKRKINIRKLALLNSICLKFVYVLANDLPFGGKKILDGVVLCISDNFA